MIVQSRLLSWTSFSARPGRASGLTAEHLAEFPDDQLIGRVQAWMGRRRGAWNPG